MQIQLKRNLQALSRLFGFLTTFARKNSVTQDILNDLELASEEIFTNFVKYNPQPAAEIAVQIVIQQGLITLTFTDPAARPFFPEKTPPPDTTLPLDQRSPGGLGLHLVHKVMDSFKSDFKNGQLHIILTKHTGDRHV